MMQRDNSNCLLNRKFFSQRWRSGFSSQHRLSLCAEIDLSQNRLRVGDHIPERGHFVGRNHCPNGNGAAKNSGLVGAIRHQGLGVADTVEAPGNWKIVRKQGGRTLLTANWNLSDDGKALTDTFIGNQPDGSTSRIDLVYKRAEGSASNSGIPGTWETTEEKPDSVYEMEIRPYEGDGLSFISSGGGPANSVKFDGKEYPPAGSDPAAGSATSARRLGDHSIELTKKLKGKIVETREITISPDLKTLTMTRHLVDQRVPNVLIFDRA